MKTLLILIKREWLEWRRVVIGTIAVITFMNLLMLLTVTRGSVWFHETMEEKGHITFEDVHFNDDESGDVDIRMNGNDIEVYIEGEDSVQSTGKWINKAAKPILFGMRFGMLGTFGFVLFLSLFYFSDAIFKERADNSTLFYRSLPVSDHFLLGSKMAAGMLGVIGLTLFLSIEHLLFIRLGFMIIGEPINLMAKLVMSQVSYIGIIWDWFSYLVIAGIRMVPLALFLMLVGAYVKGRPLIIGVGGPILLAISWAIIFKSGALLKTIGRFLWGFNQMLIDQWDAMEQGLDSGHLVYGNFWGYLVSVDTLISIMVSGLLYYAMWFIYRKNIPTD